MVRIVLADVICAVSDVAVAVGAVLVGASRPGGPVVATAAVVSCRRRGPNPWTTTVLDMTAKHTTTHDRILPDNMMATSCWRTRKCSCDEAFQIYIS